MLRIRSSRLALCLLLAATPVTAISCDREDAADVREGVEDVEEGAEDVGNEAEDQVDDMDTDGEDN